MGTARRTGIVLLLGTLALLVAQAGPAAVASGPSRPRAAQAIPGDVGDSRPTPVLQSVLSTPRWFTADDSRVHLEYEVLLTSAVSLPARPRSLPRLCAVDDGWQSWVIIAKRSCQ